MLVTTVIWMGYWILNALDWRPVLLAQWQNFTIGWAAFTSTLAMILSGLALQQWRRQSDNSVGLHLNT